MKLFQSYLLLIMIFGGNFLFAQIRTENQSNFKSRRISTKTSITVVDSCSIIPGSFKIDNISIDDFSLDEVNAVLSWKRKPVFDSVKISYRVFPFKINSRYFHLDYDSVRFNFLAEKPVVLLNKKNASSVPIFDFKGIQSDGSIGRTLSLGNNQDAVLNASLNLQLKGMIGDSLELTAAITDNNIPVQPEGNTKDIRDFDRIFIQLKKKVWQVSFGDLNLIINNSQFLKFNKRIQGASFSTKNKISDKTTNTLSLSGSLAKGKFNRNIISPVEGNQGPYRLQGANNEIYFVVLAGTEKVFIDGMLMQRGEDLDYVINYNTAELTFTPNQLITKDKRIQIEFEYADRNYLNTQFYGSDEIKVNDKLNINISAYASTDSKNAVIDQQLSAFQKSFLSGIGDSVQNAFLTNAVNDSFSVGKILYRKTDTINISGNHDSVFVYCADANERLYAVSFTYVGANKGNYRQSLNVNNGKVFEWISPGPDLVKQGDYEPLIFLVTPKKLQLFTTVISCKPSKNFNINTEMAVSNYDRNLFSEKDKNDNHGFAGKVNFSTKSGSFNMLSKSHVFSGNAGFEFVQQRFKPVERLRDVEFLRDWGLSFDAVSTEEKIMNASIELTGKSSNLINYQIHHYERGDGYSGTRQLISQQGQYKLWNTNIVFSITDFQFTNRKGSYFRPTIDLKKNFKSLKSLLAGFNFMAERNKTFYVNEDSVDAGSFGFERYEIYLKSSDKSLNKWGLNYFTRTNYLPFQNEIIRSDKSDNFSVSASLLKNEKRQFSINANYRLLKVFNGLLPDNSNDQALAGRTELVFNEFKGAINGGMFYELGGGQEQKKSFSYVAVPVGLGNYTWIDYNSNGIEELNEFEPAVFQDQKKYIRIFTPTNQYIKTNSLQFNYNVELKPSLFMMEKKSTLKKMLSRTTFNSALQINKKNMASSHFLFNPFGNKISDTNIISFNSFLSNSLFFNRTSSKWGFDLSQSHAQQKALLAYGIETRNTINNTGKIRYNLNRNFIGGFTYRNVVNQLQSSGNSFENRNYDVFLQSFEPNLTYLYKSRLRLSLSCVFSQKKNRIDSLERSVSRSLISEMKFNPRTNTGLTMRFSYNNFSWKAYQGAANTAVGFFMLEGLMPGKNYVWNMEFTKRLSGNMEVNLQYEGRKPGDTRVVNIGRASVRALF